MKSLGWHVLGVEPDNTSSLLARKRGLDVFNGTLENANLPAGFADQITMQHVLEHLPDPITTVKECFRILKKGGRLVIYTPNNESLGHLIFHQYWYPLDPPRHLYIFSKKSVSLFFNGIGFKELIIRTNPATAAKIYDNSYLIYKNNLIPGNDPVRKQKGRYVFSAKESFLCFAGKPRGEEIEIIAVK